MIGAGIVTYYPDYDKLALSLKKLLGQNCETIIYDNTPDEGSEYTHHKAMMEDICEQYKTKLVCDGVNSGVAKAYNEIMKAFDCKADFVLTLDQDTVIPDNLVENYCQNRNLAAVGILCPNLKYKNDNIYTEEKGIDNIDTCISSGSFISLKAWKDTDGFDEDMFIDFVDFDFCYSLIEKGYRIYRLNEVTINHELGQLHPKTLFGRKIMVTNHSPLRKYYYIRNAIICWKKHRALYTSKALIKDVMHNYIKAILYEDDRKNRLHMMNKGLIDGMKYKVDNK